MLSLLSPPNSQAFPSVKRHEVANPSKFAQAVRIHNKLAAKPAPGEFMRTYLVVIDETEEARLALRFASRRAAKTGGTVHILALVEQADFVAWGGVQATMEEEARDRAEQLVTAAAGSIFDEMGVRPAITVKPGEAIDVVKVMLEEHPGIAALVLGAAAQGAPGPLIAHFTGVNAGTLPCPVMVIPGSLSEAQLDELS
jgi:nucleotide-binding universal stress UspA family protein